MFDDISFLVQETLNDVEKPKENRGLFGNFFGSSQENLPEEGPGVLYHLQKKASTFVLRIYPSQNLKDDYKNVNKHPNLFPTLRLNESEEEMRDSLNFFECDNFEVARTLREQLGNKRFPLFEENVLNVSDPGDSWWLKLDENKIRILFKLSHTDNIHSLIKLGPLGDTDKYMELFTRLEGYFKMLFPLDEYSSGNGQFTISTSDGQSACFKEFKELLMSGEMSTDLWEHLRGLEMNSSGGEYLESLQKANYILMELAMIRSFWKTIQDKL